MYEHDIIRTTCVYKLKYIYYLREMQNCRMFVYYQFIEQVVIQVLNFQPRISEYLQLFLHTEKIILNLIQLDQI